jgi:hypothetical protein
MLDEVVQSLTRNRESVPRARSSAAGHREYRTVSWDVSGNESRVHHAGASSCGTPEKSQNDGDRGDGESHCDRDHQRVGSLMSMFSCDVVR